MKNHKRGKKTNAKDSMKAILKAALALSRQDKHADAVERFRTVLHENPESMQPLHLHAFSRSLNELNKYNESLAVCETFQRCINKLTQQERSQRAIDELIVANQTLHAWNLFELHVHRFGCNSKRERQLLQAAAKIVQLCNQRKGSPYAKTVLIVVDYLIRKVHPPHQEILDWLDLIDPLHLPSEQITKANPMRAISFKSDSQKYYNFRLKSLLGLNRLEEYDATFQEAQEELRGDFGIVHYRAFA